MHSVDLLVSELLISILSFLSPHNLAVACRVCRRFWQHAAPLLWADLSGPGLQALYAAFPADAVLPIDFHWSGHPMSSFRRLARPLAYEEASRIEVLARFIRKASINAKMDLFAKSNSPLSSVEDLVGGKILSNLQTIEINNLSSMPPINTATCSDDILRKQLFEILQHALPHFIGPSIKHMSFEGGLPTIPAIDLIDFILCIMIREGAAPWTFRVSTWAWGFGGPEPLPLTDHKKFTQSIEIALASVKRLSFGYMSFDGSRVTDPMLDAASRLPELTELHIQSDDHPSTSEFPCSETAFPHLQTIRVGRRTREIGSVLRRVPPCRLRNLEVELDDDDGDGFYPCLIGHSQVQSFTLRMESLDLRDVLTRLNMRQLTRLTLVSQVSGPPVTDADIELLADSFPSLVSLEIHEPKKHEEWSVTISSLRMLASRCPQLQTLALSVNMQKAALIAEPSASCDSTDPKSPTHPSLNDLDLWNSRGLGDGGASIKDVVAFIVRMYPNLKRGRCGRAPGDDFLMPGEPDDSMNIEAWWKVWKDVEGELGDSFTVAYDPWNFDLTEYCGNMT